MTSTTKLDLVSFRELAGVPVIWRNVRGSKPGARKLERKFHILLNSALSEISDAVGKAVPGGKWTLSHIDSAGAYVPREQKRGDRHATGTAFDLVSLTWADDADDQLVICADDPRLAQTRHYEVARYLAVEAILRMRFGQVLNYWYEDKLGARHRNHWHIDDAKRPGLYKKSKQCTVFVQACLKYLWGASDLDIDGVWGTQTHTAWSVLGQPQWHEFLDQVVRLGLKE